MPSAGFEPAIPATKQPQAYALDCAANGIGTYTNDRCRIVKNYLQNMLYYVRVHVYILAFDVSKYGRRVIGGT
jgi:hypothetical protein